MIQVGHNFEFDIALRSSNAEPHNHIFANMLVPLNNKLEAPIIFWLDPTFPPGVNHVTHERPLRHHVLRIGPKYTPFSVFSAVKRATKEEGVDLTMFEKYFMGT